MAAVTLGSAAASATAGPAGPATSVSPDEPASTPPPSEPATTVAPRATDESAASTVGPPRSTTPSVATGIPASTDPELVLTDQDYSIHRGATLRLVYRITSPPAGLDAAPPADAAAPPATTGAAVPPDSTSAPSTAPPGSTGSADPAGSTGSNVPAGSSATPKAPTVAVAVHPRIMDRADLDGVLAGDTPDAIDTVSVLASGNIRLEPDGSATLTVSIPTTQGPDTESELRIDRDGIYPITTTIVIDDVMVASNQTFVRLLDDDPDAAAVALTLTVVAGVGDPGPDPTDAELAAGLDELRRLDELGRAVEEAITVAIPPEVIAGAMTADPELVTSLATTLTGDEAIARPTNSVDPSALAAIGAGDTFNRELNDGEDVLGRALPATSVRRTAWVVDGELSRAGAALLRNLGARLLVMSSPLYESLPGNIGGFVDTTSMINVDVGNGRQLDGVVVDGFDELIGREPDIRTPTERAVELVTRLLVERDDVAPDERRAVVLSTSDLGVPDPAVLAVVDRIADADPDLVLRPLSLLPNSTTVMQVDGASQTVQLPERAGPDLTNRASAINLVRLSTVATASMLDPTDPRPSSWSAELDHLLSTAYTDDEVDQHLAAISADVDTLQGSVSLPAPFRFTLTGRRSTLRLRVGNDADVPLTVVVQPRSSKVRFPDGDLTVTLAPNDITEIDIAVEARTNGRSPLSVSLYTPNGERVGFPLILTANVRAVTGLGPVITGGAILILVSWWISHLWRRRRARQQLRIDADSSLSTNDISPDAAKRWPRAPSPTTATTSTVATTSPTPSSSPPTPDAREST